MSLTTTATTTGAPAATATPPSQCGSLLYDIPTGDAACAMAYGGNHTDVMASCCGQVVSYEDDCGLYCLAQGQSVEDLTKCLYDSGAAYQDVFCNSPNNATASQTGTVDPTASGASVVAGKGAKETGSSKSGNDDKDGDGKNDSSSNDNDSAAAGMGVAKTGVAIVALLLSSTLFGGLLI